MFCPYISQVCHAQSVRRFVGLSFIAFCAQCRFAAEKKLIERKLKKNC
jgi:hypothetical protein